MKKSQVNRYPKDSFEYVVLHARWQKSRGRNPSVVFIRKDPRGSLKLAERFAYFPASGTYLNGEVPIEYVCSGCGATHAKLWRGYNDFSPELTCAMCAVKLPYSLREERGCVLALDDFDADGRVPDPFHGHLGCRTDQVNGLVPAIPIEEGGGFWGYTSVPGPGVTWWRKLPTVSAG